MLLAVIVAPTEEEQDYRNLEDRYLGETEEDEDDDA
jgi:hypothetical protein